MFVELGAVGAIAYGYRRWNSRDAYYMKKEMKKIFEDNKLDYYTIIDVKRCLPWGYSIIINLNGKGFEKLSGAKDSIETKLGYETYIEQNRNLKTATIKIIVLPLTENTEFRPYKTKPYEIYGGLSYTMQELVVNMRRFPNILVSGQVGAGKTEIIRILLCNLINNFTERDVNIYFADLADVADYDVFQKCKQVKGYARTLEETEKLFNYLIHVYTKRLEIFAKNGCKNIQEYNDKFYGKRMAYDYLVLDEFGDYFPVNKLEDNYQVKVKCYNLIKHMTRKFRKVGIYLIVGIQRPDTSILDPNLKANLCTKIGFSQNNDASSLVICDTTELANIENRKALLMYGNKRAWFKSLYINDDLITEYIKLSIVNGSREELDDYNKFLPKKEVKVVKEKQNLPYATITKEKKSPKLKTKVKVKIK
ncbi:FtsK/SpoIIIE domain-containing protein [Clostridium sp. CX1]|uniref:FtsK/SpoIIIE domain-containing protein n=1 Tax=Clostridium sp. CX1 TaxID=2978346 RepID=UPI0021C14FAD|nr:FtsK/SpoIIIE domain-containing protein [Clostridium sp. CX1]MCT8976276.1 FtsK/SpoIIIE domain-containing protein [Clostridium sp. CX1]